MKKGGGNEADCVYTDLTIVGGALTVNCSSDVVLTTGGTGGTGPYTINATAAPVSSGTFTANVVSGWTCGSTGACTGSFPAGSPPSITITASPGTGNSFLNWATGPCAGSTAAACSFAITASVSLTANFSSSTTTPPPVVPTGCTGLTPTTNYEARASMGPEGQSSYHYGKAGIIYSYPLPATAKGKVLFGTTGAPLTPGGINVEITISQCPGDTTYYQTAAAKYTQFGTLKAPCGGTFNPESGGIKWSPTMISWATACLTPTIATTPWYLNVRYVTGCEGGASCPIIYFWNRQ